MVRAMTDTPPRPEIRLLPGHHRRLAAGHPWAFSNEIRMDAAAKAVPPGAPVRLAEAGGKPLGTFLFNPHSLIAARLLDCDGGVAIDADFLAGRLRRALRLREALYDQPCYRLVHAEADGLPGLVVDRIGDLLVCQANTAGMDRLQDDLVVALRRVVPDAAVLFRNDSPVRLLEGLEPAVRVAAGEVPGAVTVQEGPARFPVDVQGGQKTGWFFDQRDNRLLMARLARGRRVIDLYTHTGGFAVQAAVAGAREVLAVDSSAPALALAEQAAGLNGVGDRIAWRKARAFDEMERLPAAGERFEVTICDPPAFVKSRRDFQSGVRGYRKLARLAAGLTAPEGFVFLASCSQAVEPERFVEESRRGIADAGRTGRILWHLAAGPDHPLHPALPESAYLKAVVLQLD